MNRQPSPYQIILNDAEAFRAAVYPVVFWLIALLIVLPTGRGVGGSGLALSLILLAGLATVIGLPMLMLRVNRVRGVFEVGQEVEGVIVQADFLRERGWLDFTYVYQGKPFKGRVEVMNNDRTRQFEAGKPVVLMVDPQNPRQAFVRDLYL
jgi:hypothetical protein